MNRGELHAHLEAERRLADRLDAYPGQWVAVRDHEVVAHAGTLKQLLSAIEDAEAVDRVFQVPPSGIAGCFF